MHECTVHERINLDGMLEGSRPREAAPVSPTLYVQLGVIRAVGNLGISLVSTSQLQAARQSLWHPAQGHAPSRLHGSIGLSVSPSELAGKACIPATDALSAPRHPSIACVPGRKAHTSTLCHTRGEGPHTAVVTAVAPAGMPFRSANSMLQKLKVKSRWVLFALELLFFRVDLGCPKLTVIGRFGSAISCKGHYYRVWLVQKWEHAQLAGTNIHFPFQEMRPSSTPRTIRILRV